MKQFVFGLLCLLLVGVSHAVGSYNTDGAKTKQEVVVDVDDGVLDASFIMVEAQEVTLDTHRYEGMLERPEPTAENVEQTRFTARWFASSNRLSYNGPAGKRNLINYNSNSQKNRETGNHRLKFSK